MSAKRGTTIINEKMACPCSYLTSTYRCDGFILLRAGAWDQAHVRRGCLRQIMIRIVADG